MEWVGFDDPEDRRAQLARSRVFAIIYSLLSPNCELLSLIVN